MTDNAVDNWELYIEVPRQVKNNKWVFLAEYSELFYLVRASVEVVRLIGLSSFSLVTAIKFA